MERLGIAALRLLDRSVPGSGDRGKRRDRASARHLERLEPAARETDLTDLSCLYGVA